MSSIQSIGLTLSFKQVHKLFQSLMSRLPAPLPLLPSTFPVTAKFSRPCQGRSDGGGYRYLYPKKLRRV